MQPIVLRPCARGAARLPAAQRQGVSSARLRFIVGRGASSSSPSPSSSSPAAAASLAPVPPPPRPPPPPPQQQQQQQQPPAQPDDEEKKEEQRQFGVSARQLALLMQSALEHEEQQEAPPPSLAADNDNALSSLPSLLAALRTSIASGPPGDPSDLEARRRAFGDNLVPPPPLTPYWRLLVEALSDPTLLLLSAAGFAQLALAFFAASSGEGRGGGIDALVSSSSSSAAADWIDGAAILASVVVCSSVAAGTNYDKQNKFRALAAARDAGSTARVVRGGCERAVPDDGLRVGDVLLLEAGDVVPADALLLPSTTTTTSTAAPSSSSSSSLRVDESHLTGESDEVAKTALPYYCGGSNNGGSSNNGSNGDRGSSNNGSKGGLSPAAVSRAALYSGSKVLEGYGRALVVAVGPNSQSGLIATLVEATAAAADGGGGGPRSEGETSGCEGAAADAATTTTTTAVAPLPEPPARERTRLAAQLEDVAATVGRVGAAAAGAVFFASVVSYALSSALPAAALLSGADDPSAAALVLASLSSPDALKEYLRFFTASVAVLVVAVPEGLPLAVTLALAYGVGEMLKERNLVRRLDACEAMALCTVVCSDKTGTLTENDMRVRRVVWGGRAFGVRPSLAGGGGGGEGGLMVPTPATTPRRRVPGEKGDADVVTMVSLSLDSQGWEEDEEEQREAGAARRREEEEDDGGAAPPYSSSSSSSSSAAASVLRDLSVACIALTSTASVRLRKEEAGSEDAGVEGAPSSTGTRGSSSSSSSSLDRAGNRTECALLEFAGRLGGRLIDAEGGGGGGAGSAAEAALDGRRLGVARRLTFSSDRKRSCAVLERAPAQALWTSLPKLPEEAAWPVATAAVPSGSSRVFCKGAADVVLARCTRVLLPAAEGQAGCCVSVPLTARDRSALLRLALGDAAEGQGEGASSSSSSSAALRLLALAYRDGGEKGTDEKAEDDDPETGLTLVALVGLEDPIRAEARGAVRDCARAGIRTLMLTGDSPQTAAAIAQECGILESGVGRRRALLAARERRRARVNQRGKAALPRAWDEEKGAEEEEDEEDDGWALMEGSELRALILRPPASSSFFSSSSSSLSDLSDNDDGGKRASSSSSAAAPDVDLDALARLWPKLRVIARCTPADKHALVSGYRSLRRRRRGGGGGAATTTATTTTTTTATTTTTTTTTPTPTPPPLLLLPPGDDGVIAVTGDGTNDAPALAAADVGFGMASGTAVAKGAADILLLDDNFASVVTAVRWGRNVHGAVSRFLTFQLSASAVAVTCTAAGALLLKGETVLAPTQLLWLNLIIDSLASLALATEPPADGILDEPPRRTGAPAVSPRMAAVICSQAAFQLGVLLWLLLPAEQHGGFFALFAAASGEGGAGGEEATQRAEQLTLVFNAFVGMSLGSQVAVRAIGGRRSGSAGEEDASNSAPPLMPLLLLTRPLQGLSRAPLFVGILALEASLQFLIVQWGGRAFSTVPLSTGEWALSAALGAGALAVGAVAAAAPGVPEEWPAADGDAATRKLTRRPG